MKRVTLLLGLSCLLVAPGTAHADDGATSSYTVTLGGKLGVSAVTLGGENPGGIVFQPTYKPSYAAGGFVNVALHKVLAVQPELLFVGKGGGREADGVDRGSWNFAYIALPVLIHGRYPLGSKLDIHGLLGPELSYLVDAELENENGDTLNVRDDAVTLDVGLTFGAGITWRHSRKGALVVEARYDLGLRSIDRNDAVDAKNRALTLLLGYQWGFGSR